MSAEQNKALVRRFFEARTKMDLYAIEEMLAPNFISHGSMLPGQQPGREGLKLALAAVLPPFPTVGALSRIR